MTWLKVHDDGMIIVDTEMYLVSQPIVLSDIKNDIDYIRKSGKIYKTIIDISNINIYDIDILGFVNIIWELHRYTMGENLIDEIRILGASAGIRQMWSVLRHILPTFIILT
jgi:hypothetical protein